MEPPYQVRDASKTAELIGAQLIAFPAFADAKSLKISSAELFQFIITAHEEEQLTEEQDLILQGLVYLHRMTDEFDLRRAIAVWDEVDLLQFLSVVRSFHGAAAEQHLPEASE